MIQEYLAHVKDRKTLGVPPLSLTSQQAEGLVELLQAPPEGHEDLLVDLLEDRIAPGVDPAAKVKAEFLNAIAKGETASPLVSAERAVELLGTMLGGYNVPYLINLLDHPVLGPAAAEALAACLFVFDAVEQVHVAVETLRGQPVRGTLVRFEQSAAGHELYLEDEDKQVHLIPYHAIVRISVERDKVAGAEDTPNL